MNRILPVARGARARRVALAVVALVIASTPVCAGTLLGLIDTGELFASADGGASWTGVSALPVRDAVGLQARYAPTELYLASRSGLVYRSLDGGVSWTAVGAVASSDVEDLLVRSDGALMLLTATGSVYRSTNEGVSFTAIGTLAGSDFVSLAERADGRIYALTSTGEIYESTDLGANWTIRGTIPVADAARIRAVFQVLYVMTDTGDILKSLDGGVTWTAVGTLSQVGMRGLVADGTTLVAASREGHVATSGDGAVWTWQGSINQLTLTALATNHPATTDVAPRPVSRPQALGAPYPNPSLNGAGVFPVRLEREERVVLELCDVAGRSVARRAPEMLPAGSTPVAWTPGVARPGLYFARLIGASGTIAERRWMVLR